MAEAQVKRRRRWPWVILGLVSVYGLWWLLGPIRWISTRVERYPGNVEIRTATLHELSAYCGMEWVILPIPYHYVNDEYERALFINGKECIRTDGFSVARMYPSPSGTYVVIEDLLFKKPLRIVTTQTQGMVELAVVDSWKEFPLHAYVYPFHFLRWDSPKSFLVEVTGTGDTGDYRHTWRFDAATGNRTRGE